MTADPSYHARCPACEKVNMGEAEAKVQARRLRSKTSKSKNGARAMAMQCPLGKWWHVGYSTPTRRPRVQARREGRRIR